MSDDRTSTARDWSRLAVDDRDFLLDPSSRSLRFAMECLRAEEMFARARVLSTITVFGSARVRDGDHPLARWAAEGEKLGFALADRFTRTDGRGWWRRVVATGGGPGLMEAANAGAALAGKPTAGLCISLPWETEPNPHVTPGLAMTFHYFHIRKFQLVARAEAVVALPGGFGTMDEVFEAMTLLQTGKSHPFPLILLGREWWRSFMDLEHLARSGVIADSDVRIPLVADDAEEACDFLARALERQGMGEEVA